MTTLIISLIILYLIGYLFGWFLKGGFIRILLGIFLFYNIIPEVLHSHNILVQVGFFTGFLSALFNGLHGLKRVIERYIGVLVSAFEKTVMAFSKHFFPWLFKSKKSENKKSDKSTERESHDNGFERERKRREEEMKRERAKKKKQNESQSEKTKNNHDKTKHKEKNQHNSHRQNIRADYLKILGLNPNKTYTRAELKKAYHRQIAKYHPDRHQDKSQSFIDEMNRKIIEIKKAYEWIIKSK